MINQAQRNVIKKYFYGSNGPLLLGTAGTFIAILLTGISNGELAALPFLCVIGAIIWHLAEKYMPDPAGEQNFDSQVSQDMTDIAARAVDKLGLLVEQVSLIEPIKVRGPYYGYRERYTAAGIKRLTNWFFAFLSLFQYTPKLFFRYGSDEDVRYSMVEAYIYVFTENQVYVYTCGYDACTGDIYEERTAEYFYQDIDCVITGSRIERVIDRKKTRNKRYEYFKLIVTSGTSTRATVDCKDSESFMATQVRGMRELVRSKKEEITL